MLSISYLFEDQEDYDRDEMIDFFNDRTHYHIDLVNKYLQKIIELHDERLDNNILEKEQEDHDESKFEDPEYLPYIEVTWKYHMKDKGIDYNPEKEIEKEMQIATFHHVKTNKHHPESWDENSTLESINNKDRDKPPEKIVDATKMPFTYIAEMVADWCAMSKERGNNPHEWAKNNINKRWKFDKEQEDFIYELLSKIWEK